MQASSQRVSTGVIGLLLVINGLHSAGGTLTANASSQRRLQATPRMLTLPFPNPELCSPRECSMFIPASAFPPEMSAHESREQFEQLKLRYTEVISAIQRQQGLPPAAKLSVIQFVNYARGVAHDSAATFDPPVSDGNWACDLSQMQRMVNTNGSPGAPVACITWMQIYKVFLFYEAQVLWENVALNQHGITGSWCATNDNLPEGSTSCPEPARSLPGACCPEPGTCWPECAPALQTAQPGLEPEWCSPWPGCSEPGALKLDVREAETVATSTVIVLLLCGMCMMFALMKGRAHFKRRGGKRYQKVSSMDGVELAVDFGDDETEYYGGKEKVVPTSG